MFSSLLTFSVCKVRTSCSRSLYNLGMGAVDSFALDFNIL